MFSLKSFQKLPVNYSKIQILTPICKNQKFVNIPYVLSKSSMIGNNSYHKNILFQNNVTRYQFVNLSKNSDKTVEELPESLKNQETFELANKEIPNPVHRLVQPGKEKLIGSWLLLTAGGVFFMIVLGGYTRLSDSGLSMTKWKPVDPRLPQNDEEWNAEFDHYKQYPEYKLKNMNMELEGFKKIFFVEWFHRLVGSSLGVVFSVPLVYFLARKQIKAPFQKRLGALFVLGGSQGLIGWWMVRSGMNEKPDYQTKPRVSVYRLMVHLNTALVIYGGLLWNALTLLRKPQEQLLRPENLKATKNLRFWGIMLIHCIALNTLSGAAAAGIDACKVFNDWPLYNGKLFPPEMWASVPFYKNFFENRGTVQFNHRNFGYLTATVGALMFFKCRNLNLLRNQKIFLYAMMFIISLQVASGIATLLNGTKAKEANSHQMTAILVLTTAILLSHSARKPSKIYSQYLQKFIQ